MHLFFFSVYLFPINKATVSFYAAVEISMLLNDSDSIAGDVGGRKGKSEEAPLRQIVSPGGLVPC
jgi:hypothetical protein